MGPLEVYRVGMYVCMHVCMYVTRLILYVDKHDQLGVKVILASLITPKIL